MKTYIYFKTHFLKTEIHAKENLCFVNMYSNRKEGKKNPFFMQRAHRQNRCGLVLLLFSCQETTSLFREWSALDRGRLIGASLRSLKMALTGKTFLPLGSQACKDRMWHCRRVMEKNEIKVISKDESKGEKGAFFDYLDPVRPEIRSTPVW